MSRNVRLALHALLEVLLSRSSRPLVARNNLFVLMRTALLAAALAACAKTAPTPGGLGDPCIANADCATGFVCSGGICALPANLGGCEAGLLRCNGDAVEQCAADGESWGLVTTCETGCVAGACAPQVCTPNTMRCEGDASEECTPSGNGWAFLQECPAHCDSSTGLCKAPICTPFATSCSQDGLSVLTCDSFGASQTSAACTGGSVCSDGRCIAQVCTPNARQCANNASEQCAPDGSTWVLLSVCSSACDAATGQCIAPICTPFSQSCSADQTAVLTCDAYGAAEVATLCGNGQICDSGRCQTVVCSPGSLRCATGAASLEVCNASGDGWVAGDACPYNCAGTPGNASCLAPACNAGDTRCSPSSPSALEQCLPDQTGWAFESFCATGCEATGANSAACAPLVCAPLARRCEADDIHVDTCNQLGTEWDLTDTCPQGCQAGQCVTASANCSPGELRCNGPDTQSCANVANDPGVTVWSTTGTCLAGCSSGACLPGGSCAGLSLELGAPLSDAGVPTAPGDGQSTVLVYSDPILGEDGALLPDGEFFTVSATLLDGGADGGPLQLALPTADADPSTPGTQVASSGGRIRFTVPALALASGAHAAVQVAASLEQGGSCAAASSFALDQTLAGVSVLVAEDFSTTSFRDASNTTANWSTTQQQLSGTWPDAIGAGSDGSLTVSSANTPYNLATSGYAAAFAVLGLSAQGATVDGTAQGLSGGDEVLLWDAQGSAAGAGNAGIYELLTVQSIDGSNVTFTSPVQNSYGAAADQDVSTQRVVLQRVPHFATLTVTSGSTLTTSAWDGTKGGLIFVRATKVVLGGAPTGTAAALIDVSGLGFRGGIGGSTPASGEDATGPAGLDAPGGGAGGAGSFGSGGSYGTAGSGGAVGNTYGTKLLGKLFLGAGGGGTTNGNAGAAGGGAAVLFAGSIDFTSNGVTVGQVRANGANGTSSGSGAGGSIWIGSPSITAGPGTAPGTAPLALASGGSTANAGGAGRVRVDAQALDSPGFGAGTSCARATPACSFGVLGALQGQSLADFTVSGNESIVSQAALLVALDASSNITFSASANGTGFGSVATGVPLTFGASGPSPVGPTFRWRATIAPDPTRGASVVRGFQWQLQVK